MARLTKEQQRTLRIEQRAAEVFACDQNVGECTCAFSYLKDSEEEEEAMQLYCVAKSDILRTPTT